MRGNPGRSLPDPWQSGQRLVESAWQLEQFTMSVAVSHRRIVRGMATMRGAHLRGRSLATCDLRVNLQVWSAARHS